MAAVGVSEADGASWATRIKRAEDHQRPWLEQALAAKAWRTGSARPEGDIPQSRQRQHLRTNLLQLRHWTRIASLVAQEPKWVSGVLTAAPLEEAASDLQAGRSELNEAYLRYLWRTQFLRREIRKVVADVSDFGRGIVMVDYVAHTEFLPVRQLDEDEEGAEVGPHSRRVERVRHEQHLVADTVNTFRVDPRRFLFEPEIQDDPLSSPWIVLPYRMRREDVMRAPWTNPAVATKAAAQGPHDKGDQAYKVYPNDERHYSAECFELLDCWDKAAGLRLTYIRGYWEAPLHVRSWLPGAERGGLKLYPFVVFQPRGDNDEAFTRPDAQDLIGLQRAVQELTGLEHKHAIRSLARLLYQQGSESAETINRVMNSPVEAAVPVQELGNKQWFSPPHVGPALRESRDAAKRLFDELGQTSSFQRGQEASRKLSATEAMFVESGARSLSDLDQDDFTMSVIQVGQLQLRVAAANLQRPVVFAANTGTRWQAYAITADQLQPDTDLEIQAGGIRFYDQQAFEQQTLVRVQTLMQLFPGQVDQQALLRILLATFGWSNEQVEAPVPPEYAPFLESVKDMLRAGMDPQQAVASMQAQFDAAEFDLDEAQRRATIKSVVEQQRVDQQGLDAVRGPRPHPASGSGGR